MLTTYFATQMLNYGVGRQALAQIAAYVALFTTAPTDETGAGLIEVSGTGYARAATVIATWNAATPGSGSTPSSISNNATITFNTAGTGGWGTLYAAGLYDNPTPGSGNLLMYDWLGPYPWLPVTISSGSPATFTVIGGTGGIGPGYAIGDDIVFTTIFGGFAPTLAGGSGSLGSNNVSVVATLPATDTFTITTAGTAVNTTTTGSGFVRKIVPQQVPQGVQPSYAGGTPGTFVISGA
jgi:hypothetical protein